MFKVFVYKYNKKISYFLRRFKVLSLNQFSSKTLKNIKAKLESILKERNKFFNNFISFI